MPIRFPAPLRPGDLVGITSPSSGVAPDERARLEFAVEHVRSRGFEVLVGECMDGSTHASAPAHERARELSSFLTDPRIRAIVPPWGGETAIDILSLLEWDAIDKAPPTWFVGYSDISTLITPLTLRTGIATVHGNNLMDTPYRVPDGLVGWLDIVTLDRGAEFEQAPTGAYRATGHDSYRRTPEITDMTLNGVGSWVRLDDAPGIVDVAERLVGGCIDTLCNVAGTPFGNTAEFSRLHAPEGLIIYLEASDEEALSICRYLHGMRIAGFFDRANAILVGRTRAPDSASMTQHEAVRDALGSLGIPIIGEVDCGHVQPFMPIVNGALGRVRFGGGQASLVQTLA